MRRLWADGDLTRIWLNHCSRTYLILQSESESVSRSVVSDSLQKAMAPHSRTLAWKIPWTEEPGRLQSMGSRRVGDNWATSLSCIGEGNGNPLQCSCLENPRDRGAWWAAVYGVAQSRTRLKRLSSSSSRLQPTRILCPWNSPGKNTRVDSHTLYAGELPDPGSELKSPALQAHSLPSESPGKPSKGSSDTFCKYTGKD